MAAHPENSEITRILIAAGSDINYKNTKGKSALSYAKDNKAQKIIEMLTVAGAK